MNIHWLFSIYYSMLIWFVQYSNEWEPIVETDSGMVSDSPKLEQCEKDDLPIVIKSEFNDNSVKLEHDSNAYDPISVTDSGITSIPDKFVHFWKDPCAIVFSWLLNCRDVKLSHP